MDEDPHRLRRDKVSLDVATTNFEASGLVSAATAMTKASHRWFVPEGAICSG